jgi:RNA polymerase sigma factor (sigma-70 family)
MTTPMRDAALCERWQRCADAFARDRLLAKYERSVAALADELGGDEAERDDLAQEGRMALLRAIDRYRRERGSAFSVYALHCIRRAIVWTAARAVRRRGDDPGSLPPSVTVEEQLIARELDRRRRALLRSALAALPAPERLVVEERLMAEEPVALELLARNLGIAPSAVLALETRAVGALFTSCGADGVTLLVGGRRLRTTSRARMGDVCEPVATAICNRTGCELRPGGARSAAERAETRGFCGCERWHAR